MAQHLGHFSAMPPSQGLYHSPSESDACGVGFIANFKSHPSHDLVKNALVMLARMDHRGGCGCEKNTGDGAGVMVGIPHAFMVDVTREDLKIVLPKFEDYGVGNVFLPQSPAARAEWKDVIKVAVEKRGLKILGWRVLPVDNTMIGPSALRTEPFVEQLYVGPKPAEWDSKKFDLELYIIKQQVTKLAFDHAKEKNHPPAVYFCSLSCQTLVYKGQLTAPQVPQYYLDLADPRFASHFALVHSRFSTNTFPSWDRAHPMRMLCHNGEINTLRGNKNWMFAREGVMNSPFTTDAMDGKSPFSPICSENYSDSGNLDACLELLSKASDRSLPECVMMMLPEAWEHDTRLDEEKRAFYEYNSCAMEPWDGPAMIAFADGRYLGCTLDRNGLRPHRYYVTNDVVIAASEVGVIPDIDPASVVERGRLQPGKMFLVDFVRQGIVRDDELKSEIASSKPYNKWVRENLLRLSSFISKDMRMPNAGKGGELLVPRMVAAGYTVETLDLLLQPMVDTYKEALGSMGTDTPIAVLSLKEKPIYHYFHQLFAQVTNPPMDSIREDVVMAMECPIGPEANLLLCKPETAARLILENPILSPHQMQSLLTLLPATNRWSNFILDATFNPAKETIGEAVARLCRDAVNAIKSSAIKCLILSDAKCNQSNVSIPSLVALGAVHQHLLKVQLRTKVALIVEGGDVLEVHHYCLLIGYGADGIHPYQAYEAISYLMQNKKVESVDVFEDAVARYVKACTVGIKKVMGKIGISTIQSYKGAQIFEAVGIGSSLIELCFQGTASRLGGIDLNYVGNDALRLHRIAYGESGNNPCRTLRNPGEFHYRDGGESHYNSPAVIVGIQRSAIDNNVQKYKEYAAAANAEAKRNTLRGLFKFRADPIPINEVEPAKEIVRRFVTGAMSFGSISKEAHETLAIAMNLIGGKSNTGEGGEDSERFSWRGENGESKRSAIKQVASGRFGVTSNYLTNADEIQIKMAQGAKPGEGGELPGNKVMGEIPKVRKSTEGVGLISPPPHHDIYSIEDLAQLIFDLKNANRRARISVKLVSEVGVGVVAAGVAKAKADHITISGYDGGTGAAAWTGVKHAGLPWELGLAEAQQTLVLNGLRSRVVLQTDGQLKTGRDVACAFLLGAEEVGFATAPLIALGCIMMRKCHLNTCPVGIATQDPELRAKFTGKPEHVVNFLFMVAEETREYMAHMGFRTVKEMVGRADYLEINEEAVRANPKLATINLSALNVDSAALAKSSPLSLLDPDLPVIRTQEILQEHEVADVLDVKLITACKASLEKGERTKVALKISNLDRSVGAMLSNEISRRYGENGLPDNTISVDLKGFAGQSFGAFLTKGVTLRLEGDANDFVGKGLSGGTIIVRPSSTFVGKSESNMIVGNVALYGATSGRAFFRGIAGERFCVRNSGGIVVVEGCGDHGCEYMTGGRATILGLTGRNFGAGMSGGIAYVLDEDGQFKSRCNTELIDFEALNMDDEAALRSDIASFVKLTGSVVGQRVLDDWLRCKKMLVKVFPRDLKKVLREKMGTKGFVAPFWFPNSNVGVVGGALSSAAASSSSGIKRNVVKAERMFGDTRVSDLEDVLSSNSTLQMHLTEGTPSGKPASTTNAKAGGLNKYRSFIEYDRKADSYRAPLARIKDWKEINLESSARNEQERKVQAARCMDCGTPFCQTHDGCPIHNLIPEWNLLVYQDQWKEAFERLMSTNNFPEFTGRVCPAPCEGSCVAGLVTESVTIKNIEYAIIERAWKEGWMVARPPVLRYRTRVAIVGSGPAGLSAADQLNKMGHNVTVYERDDRVGGLLMYGIPSPKLDKGTVERRINIMREEGVRFVVNAHVGVNPEFGVDKIRSENDALLLTVGACASRDLPISGRKELKGIHLAMSFLSKNTKNLLDEHGVEGVQNGELEMRDWGKVISAKGKRVVVIGGGDTGADCIATSIRHGCKSVVNLELLPQPPKERAPTNPWPEWPLILRTDYAHAEAKDLFGNDPRQYSILTKAFVGDASGNVSALKVVSVEWVVGKDGKKTMKEVPGSERELPCDLVVLALGFLGPEATLLKQLKGLVLDERSNIKAKHGEFRTSLDDVFAAGDCRRGQSLVVWAINEGRGAADAVNAYLKNKKLAEL